MSNLHDASKLPPQNLDAERSVLGSAMIVCQCLDEVSQIITPDDFYLDAHRVIFKTILKMGANGADGIDALSVAAELEKTGKAAEVGGIEYLIKIVDSIPHAGHAKYHAKIVREMANYRRAIYAMTEGLRNAYETRDTAAELIQNCAGQLQALLESKSGNSARVIHDIALESYDRYLSPVEPGVRLGFAELDSLYYGTERCQLMILAARPGVGKSALANNIVRHFANREPVFMASIEMTTTEVFDRLMCSDLGISLSELRAMARDEHERDKVDEVRNQLAQLPIVIDDSTQQTVAGIAAQCRLLKKRQGLGLIVVDYLQLIVPDNKRDSREQQVGKIAWDLKCLGKSLDVPVLALAQLNRDIEKRPDKRPRMADLRESGAIEQHAGKVMFIDRPALWDPENHDKETADLWVEKNRGGRTGKVDLKWDGRSATFTQPESLAAGFGANDYAMPGDVDFI